MPLLRHGRICGGLATQRRLSFSYVSQVHRYNASTTFTLPVCHHLTRLPPHAEVPTPMPRGREESLVQRTDVFWLEQCVVLPWHLHNLDIWAAPPPSRVIARGFVAS